MSIVAADIEFRYSGGASNTSPAAALGGAMSTLAGGTVDDNVKNDLFSNVTGSQATTGYIDYRGIYIKNNHGTITFDDARIFITSDTTSVTEEIDIGIAVEAVNVTMATIANATTAPTSVVFSHPATYAAGLQLNGATGLTAGSIRGVWLRRTVNAGTAVQADNSITLRVEGNTT